MRSLFSWDLLRLSGCASSAVAAYAKSSRNQPRSDPVGTSPHDAERKMRDPCPLDHPGALQLYRLGAQMVEQPDAPSEQDGHQVYVYLVEQPRPDALLRDASGAHGDVLVARDRFRLLDGAFDAVRDERERRSFVNPFSGDGVGDDEGRYAQGGLPPHPLVMSNVLRPVTNAPILLCASRRSSALCGETLKTISVPGNLYSVSPLEYHAKSRSPPSPRGRSGPSFAPAMKPSSEIESPVEILPMFILLSWCRLLPSRLVRGLACGPQAIPQAPSGSLLDVS